jgi:membrane protein
MPDRKELKNKIISLFLRLRNRTKKITLPFFDKVPLYDVALFFWKGIVYGSITTRASAVAFNFILAMLPAIIFVFAIIPYVPIENFQTELLDLIQNLVPENAYLQIRGTVEDIVSIQRSGLLSFGFFAAIFFASNGIDAIISAFNSTVHAMETRSWINQRFVALFLVLIMFLLMTLGVSLITIGQVILDYLVNLGILRKDFMYYMLLAVKWLIICGLFFFSSAFLFYFAPAKRSKFRFISAGGTLATALVILTSLAFSYYINNFGSYNKLYGSIGTLAVVMVWLYFNSLILLVGFELNVSISTARENSHEFSAEEIHEEDLI